MLLYHGSNVAVAKPQLLAQTRGLDFGAGFYLTTNEKQAVRFSDIVVKRRKYGIPIVSVYEFEMETAEKTLAIHKFESANVEWLSFVTDNRLKIYQGESFDIVIGAVANDTVMPAIQAYLGGFINVEAALITLKTSKLVDQICLKSERALDLLHFVKSYRTKGGGANG
jgi:hypothetical protein